MVRRARGFTLVELMAVLAIIALLLSIVAPHYAGRVTRAEETVLRENLVLMRNALDQHYADRGRYPEQLEALVARRYLRAIPLDPLTQRNDTWVAVPPPDPDQGGVYDVRSGAPGVGPAGEPYAEW